MYMIRISIFAATVMIAAMFLPATILGQDRSKSNVERQSSRTAAPSAIFIEDFDYPASTALTTVGWTAHSAGGTNPITVTSPGLTMSGYPSSGVGNAVSMTTSGEDVNRSFPVQSTGSLFAAFLVNVSEASVDPAGGYFFHLGPSPVGTTFRGRVFAKKDGSNNLAFGISKSLTTAADIVFTPFSYSLNTTYLIVVKYTFVDGATNDTVAMIVSSSFPGTEPAATVTASDVTQTDVAIGTVSLRQGAVATSPTVRVDGIRIATSWAELSTALPGAVIDFDGNGRTDLTVVRNTGGGPSGQITWFINYGGTSTTVASAWGLSGDFFVPVDYDGDQKTDIAVWRAGAPTVASFYILQSATNTVRVEVFGQTGDDPTIVDDYNGDGKADLAVYRAGANSGDQSIWFYRASVGGPVIYTPWGQNGDFVAPGDYDGDGKADFVVQRNNGGGQARFWMNQTTAGISSVVFGTPTDVIVPGDYDGDGKTDLAVVRGVGGQYNWFVRPSSTGAISGGPTAVFGSSATDFTAQGDYDGDGKTDIGIWRPSAVPGESIFWYSGSTSGAFGVPFGQNGDYPVANYNGH